MSQAHQFVGFGFGPIQSGLFVKEAYASGRFGRIVVAEVVQDLVDAVRANGNRYTLNVAHADRIERVEVKGVEMLNPAVARDRAALAEALAGATEVVTSLPSVRFFDSGDATSVAGLLSAAFARGAARPTIVYAAENNNRAAEILEERVRARGAIAPDRRVRFLNTVIGKMSRVVTDPCEIGGLALAPVVPGIQRAFLVEAFNHILVTRAAIPGFAPGIGVFEEKDDLLPFEEAKLYGHNAVHALLAYLGALRGCAGMTDIGAHADLMSIARAAFLDESGAALIRRHGALGDPLFTASGYRAYAEDLLRRMTNPFLADTVARAGRDPVRKLAYDDRICGTMALALEQGIQPRNMALGAAAALRALLAEAEAGGVPAGLRTRPDELRGEHAGPLLRWVWGTSAGPRADAVVALTADAVGRLRGLK